MLALVSTLGHASAETWDQKLDLTIPSLEMPSTWQLDSKDKHVITLGWTCCYHPSLVTAVQKEHSEKSIALRLKENPNQLQFTQPRFIEPAHWTSWAVFTGLHYLDIKYTHRALQYECVYEANPILPNRPSWNRLVLHKAMTLIPIYSPRWNKYPPTDKDLLTGSLFMSVVVMHNQRILEKVERNVDLCPKIGTI